jgi:hypothetical protein
MDCATGSAALSNSTIEGNEILTITLIGTSFWVMALQDIGEKIKKGFHVLIDPDAIPTLTDFVLVGDSLEHWQGQTGSRGVVVLAGEAV